MKHTNNSIVYFMCAVSFLLGIIFMAAIQEDEYKQYKKITGTVKNINNSGLDTSLIISNDTIHGYVARDTINLSSDTLTLPLSNNTYMYYRMQIVGANEDGTYIYFGSISREEYLKKLQNQYIDSVQYYLNKIDSINNL